MEDLWHEASTAVGGSDSAEAATRKIGRLDDERVQPMLIALAKGKDVEFSNEHIQKEAVLTLVNRNEDGTGVEISSLLSPKESLTVRSAVAVGLSRVQCPEKCIQNILSYLEFVQNGGINIEDEAAQFALNSPASKEFVEKAMAPVFREQKEMYAQLRSVLAANMAVTQQVLREEYDLGSASRESAQFASELLDELKRERAGRQ